MTETTLNGEAIDRLTALVKNAADFTVHSVSPPGLSPGLPTSFPIGMDHRDNPNGQGPVSLRKYAEEWRLFPERRRGIASTTTISSFIALVNYHKTASSAVFAKTNAEKPALLCVINYHPGPDGNPAWCDHRISYDFPISPECAAWTGQNGDTMSQAEFAAWIEEHIADLADPSAAEIAANTELFRTRTATPIDMVQLSRGLQVNVQSVVKSATVLQTGEASMIFQEEHKNDAGQPLTVPGMFMISIPLFVGGAAVRIPARLRYRVSSGKVVWFYQLFRWQQAVRDRIIADLDLVRQETLLPAYEGHPEP